QNQQNQQPKDQEAKQDNTKQQQQPDSKISKEQAERMLEALKNNEKELQKNLRRIKGKVVKPEKDW
ncbi:MAG: tetratricopeptide repeat protein, partial [Ignavibacterium sp.]